VQVTYPQLAAVPAQAPVSNPTPAPPPLSSAPSQQSQAPTRSSFRKRDSNGSDEGSNSSRSRSRKKGGKADCRWSKRFQWPDELHREFVSAVFDVGLKHSSPSAILEHMTPNEAITSERIKSHLQKYRLHRQRSKREFMSSYDSAMGQFKSAPGGVLGDPDEVRTLNCGEAAAHLSCSTSSDPNSKMVAGAKSETTPPMSPLPASNKTDMASTPAQASIGASAQIQTQQRARTEEKSFNQGSFSGGALHLPQLTEEEKRSPIGASMGYLMGLFFSLDQQLQLQRKSGATCGNVTSFAQGAVPSAASPGTVGAALGTEKYLPPVAPPVQGTWAPLTQAPTMVPPPQAALVSVPAPTQGVSVRIAHAPAPFAPVQTYTQELAPVGKVNSPVSVGNSGQSSVVSHPSFQPPPANARHPTQPHLPLHSHSASIIEENDMMKRDMRSQMAFQNKMRALKEQEQRKYRTTADASIGSTKHEAKHPKDDSRATTKGKTKTDIVPKIRAPDVKMSKGPDAMMPSEVVGESSNSDGRVTDSPQDTIPQLPASVAGQSCPDGKSNTAGSGQNEVAAGAAPDEFWNADVVDEQLFEFLMS